MIIVYSLSGLIF